MPRYFTLDQANRTLPSVVEAVQKGIQLKAAMESAEEELRETNRRVMMSGGMKVDRERIAAVRAARDAALERLRESLESIHSLGCQVKDLDVGLLDFPTLYKGQEVYLCWKLGEDRIEFWHGEEGFRGRKPIDDEFLANHKGDPAA
jgi:hypothetical protein